MSKNWDETQPIIRMEYKGWKIVAHHQLELKPYLPYVAIATKEIDGVITGFNKEGTSKEEAIKRAIQKIDSKCIH